MSDLARGKSSLKRRTVLVVALLGASLPASAGAAPAIYFAGPTGCSDTGPGSESQPFCTLQRGATQLKPGDTLNLLSGTFRGPIELTAAGTAQSPIVIQAAPEAAAVIDGQGVPLSEAGLLAVAGAKYLTLRGFTVQNSTYWCVEITKGEGVVVDDLTINGCDHGGLIIGDSTNVQVLGTEINRTNLCTGVCIHEALTLSNVKNFVVARCWVHHGTKEGIDVKDGSANGKVHGNVVHQMAKVGIYLNHAVGVEVYDNRQGGLQLTTGDGATGTPRVVQNRIYKNLIWKNDWDGIHFWIQAPGEMRENLIYNNDLYGNGHAGILLDADPTVIRDNVFRNNIFLSNQLGSIVGGPRTVNTISNNLFFKTGDPVGTTVGTDAVTGDPLFTNAPVGSFFLTAGSPAINKGYDMGLPTIGLPDIGVFEYGINPFDGGPRETGPDARGDGTTYPDPGCGCAAGRGVDAWAEAWPLLLLGLVWAASRRLTW